MKLGIVVALTVLVTLLMPLGDFNSWAFLLPFAIRTALIAAIAYGGATLVMNSRKAGS